MVPAHVFTPEVLPPVKRSRGQWVGRGSSVKEGRPGFIPPRFEHGFAAPCSENVESCPCGDWQSCPAQAVLDLTQGDLVAEINSFLEEPSPVLGLQWEWIIGAALLVWLLNRKGVL